jgi:hypothetical protein
MGLSASSFAIGHYQTVGSIVEIFEHWQSDCLEQVLLIGRWPEDVVQNEFADLLVSSRLAWRPALGLRLSVR